MVKLHLWRKHSYVRVENDNPGCAWTFFRILTNNRWYNMVHHKKQKSYDQKLQSDDVNQYHIHDDALKLDSVSVNSSSSRALSTSIPEEDDKDEVELSTPTLLSLLKPDPKLDIPRRHRLSRSGTFPSPNTMRNVGFRRTPCKLEDKHAEIWPIINHGYELRKAKSLSIAKSSSLNEARLHEVCVSFIDRRKIEDTTSENTLPIEEVSIYEIAEIFEKEVLIEEYNEELEYVKHVLDVLGFVGGEVTVECLNESLDPELFDEIEVLCPFDPKFAPRDLAVLDRKVLFHLTIEALVDIHDKMIACCSGSLASFSSRDTRIVEEVWGFASKYLNWSSEFDPNFDVAIGSELGKISWKSSGMESEVVGLDLEELVFDELLNEILSFD